jgi:hypothetical protein
MSEGGKGSKPRPFSISQDEYDARWDAIFQRDIPKEERVSTKIEDGFELESLDPDQRSWYYDEYGVKRKKEKEEVKIKATILDVKLKGSI